MAVKADFSLLRGETIIVVNPAKTHADEEAIKLLQGLFERRGLCNSGLRIHEIDQSFHEHELPCFYTSMSHFAGIEDIRDFCEAERNGWKPDPPVFFY